MKKFLIGFSLLVGSSLAIEAKEVNDTLQHATSWAAVLQKAQQEDKLIFVDCYFTGCHPCAQMDKEVFPNEIVKAEMSKDFIGIKIDVFKEKLGDTINMKYGLSGYPTFLILNKHGQLISMFSGFKDAGLLLNEMIIARKKNSKKVVLSGFTSSITVSYEQFYKDYYNREERKSNPAAANAWIKQQSDWSKEPVALAIFKTRQLEPDIEEYVVNNFTTYLEKYGELLVIGKVSDILSARLDKALSKTKDEREFRSFLTKTSKQFPQQEWRVMNFLLGYKYYGSIAKDTMALLKFINEDPLVYANYVGAIYSNLMIRKQLNETTLKLLCSWAAKAVNEESPFDLIRSAAFMHKQNGDMEGFKEFMNMAIRKAKKYKVSAASYEKMLATN